MSFHTMRLLIEIAFSLHFFLRCRFAFGGGWWQAPVLLCLIVVLLPGEVMPGFMGGLLKFQPVWIGSLVLFTVAALGLDIARLLAGLAGALTRHSWWPLLSAKRAVPAAIVLTVGIVLYANYMARNPGLQHIVIQTRKLPEDVQSLRVVQLSDVHLGSLIDVDDLKKVVTLAAEAKPDMVVMTGDLVDDDMSARQADAALLATLAPRYGMYAVLGNHEYHSGLENSLRFIERAGFKLLRGEAVETGGIVVAGIDDESLRHSLSVEPVRLLREWQDSGLFVLSLKHRPSPPPGADGLYDLQLSGHTHGGQMWPGHFLIRWANSHYLSGLYEKSGVYVSRGSGFWGMPLRFLAPPEVTLIELVREREEQ